MTFRVLVIIVSIGLAISGWSSRATAEPTMQVSVPDDAARMYSQGLNVTIGELFEVAVVINSDGHDVSRARFAMTELRVLFPGVFRLGTYYPTPIAANTLDGLVGQYDIVFNGCAPACETLEVLRVTYLDMAGAISGDTLLAVSGLGPEEAGPKPTISDCQGTAIAAPMGGPDATSSPDECNNPTTVPAGALWINGICLLRSMASEAFTPYAACDAIVDNGRESVGVLKSRY